MSTPAAIPTGKLVHATPETAPMVEGRLPADMGTVPCDPPEGRPQRA